LQTTVPNPTGASDRWLAYARLIRLPNVFSAVADVAMGTVLLNVVSVSDADGWGWLAASSALLYAGGMVSNDLFDLEEDRRDRPKRPLPAGAVPLRSAVLLAAVLFVVGVALAAVRGSASGLVAVALVGAIFAYNGWLKRTPIGPPAMGACRLINVVLALSPALAAVDSLPTAVWLAPLANGLYITGVTLIAKKETTVSPRGLLVAGAATIGFGFVVHAVLVAMLGEPTFWWRAAGIAFSIVLFHRIGQALHDPAPSNVQRAVKTGVLGLIAFDALAVLGLGQPLAAILILGLLAPALLLGRWLYST
jgi:4-hydroxybenzoate polyprenyltransferase